MKKFQKSCLAVFLVLGMAFALGDHPLWFASIDHGQVAFPWIFDCKYGDSSTFNESKEDDPCFKTLGGWWFGYVAGPSVEGNEDIYNCGTSETRRSGLNSVNVKMKDGLKNFVGPDYSSCEGPDVTNRLTGESQLENEWLEVVLKINGNDTYSGSYEPDIAAFAVNLSTPPNPNAPVFTPWNISACKGLYLEYTSDHDDELSANGSDGHDVALELGWDDVGYPSGDAIFDSWLAYLPKALTPTTINLSWEGEYERGDRYSPNYQGEFQQGNWAETPYGIVKAIKEMTAIKIRLKGYDEATVNFKLYEIGFLDDCKDKVVSPIIHVKNAQNGAKFMVENNMLSANINKPAMVQIYNLQGAVVQSQMLSPDADGRIRMNLSKLPTGVYMARIPSTGLTSRIMVK